MNTIQNISTGAVEKKFKVSASVALHLLYSNLTLSVGNKIYTNKGANARAVQNWLEKNFDAKFSYGNDAPRGGKIGNFIQIVSIDAELADAFFATVKAFDEEIGREIEAKRKQKAELVEDFTMTDEEIEKFIAKTADLSNKKTRQKANNEYARKSGFFDTDGTRKVLDIVSNFKTKNAK